MEHMEFLCRLFDFSDIKIRIISFFGMVGSAIFTVISLFSESVLGISAGFLILLVIIMITDYITGLCVAVKKEIELRSKRGLGWVFKLGSYLVALAASLFLRKELILNGFGWLEIPLIAMHFYILTHILLWELKSVDENFKELGYDFKVFTLITELFVFLQSSLKRKFNDNK